MKSRVVFADAKLKKAFEDLKDSRTEDKELYKQLRRAFGDLQENTFCGIQIPKKQIPKDYTRKYQIDNLWKYNLPSAWRLIYSVAADKVMVISIVIEWMDHKKYEKRFKY
jgi:Txe/YoeB family toxin of Txe-Axe toxin-antitoxin module